MKTNAAEYFRSLSPLKDARSTPGVGSHESRTHNGRSGRCHCCPYGYHIDLDFVRYCDMLTQGSKNDSPTLRQLKKLKRARRRQTKSMEVLLGLSSEKENEVPDYRSQERLEIIEEPYKSDSIDRGLPSKSRRLINTWQERTPPSLPLRQFNTKVKSYTDATSTTHSSKLSNSNSNLSANDALQEAVLDFEEMFENSQEGHRSKSRSETLPTDISLFSSPHSHYPSSPKLGTGLGRSHSLPRQFLDDSSLLQRRQRTNSASSLSSVSSAVGQPSASLAGTLNGGISGLGSYVAQNSVGIIQQHTGPSHLSEALAALSAAQGYPVTQPDFDTMSVTSAMSGVSTSTLQSIRDQMAVSLNRLKDLEDEVKTIPMLQIKLNVLKEEKRLLVHQLKSIKKGDDVSLLLPPSLDGDLSDLSEDELEGRLVHLRSAGMVTSRTRRRRSESPLRVNLEEFHSYRRARRGSVSEGSEADSVAEDVPLFIKEAHDPIPERRINKDQFTERRSSLNHKQSSEGRLSHSMPSTPLVVRKHSRDAATNCRVITRDIGITHIGSRTRSVGVTTDKVELDKKREIKAKPCMHCFERNKKTYDSKSVGTHSSIQRARARSLSMSSVSLESFDPDDADADIKDVLDKDGNSKTAFLQKLGRKSAIISRLSEPQLAPPVLTFDNSTNTDPIRQRDQRVNTNLSMTELFTKADLREHITMAKKDWEEKQKLMRADLFTKAELNEYIAKAKEEWEAKQKLIVAELFTKADLNEHISKAKRDWEVSQKQIMAKLFTKADLNEHISKAKRDWEVNQKQIMAELFTKAELNEHVAKSKEEWEVKQNQIMAELFTKAELNEHVAKSKEEWEVKQKLIIAELFTKTDLNEHITKAKREWEANKKLAVAAMSTRASKLLTSNCAVQVSMDDPALVKTTFQPLLQSIGVMVKPTTVDTGVGKGNITDDVYCEKCAKIKTKSIAVGNCSVYDVLCDKCANVKTRSIAVGDIKLSDIWCEKCSSLQTRTIGCSSDKISDRICDRCDMIRTRSVSTGSSLPMEKTIKESPPKLKSNVYVQTKGVETRTTSVNTVPINLKKDELTCESSGPPSPALTPEVERRAYGSSGVRICDKCHETIHSVAKDIVNTSGTASATNLPPLPPQMSKIPRLIDITKVDSRLDTGFIPELKVTKNMSSSLTESQLSSMNSNFLDIKNSGSTSTSFCQLDSSEAKAVKTEHLSNILQEPLASKGNQGESSVSTKTNFEVGKSSDMKEVKGSLISKTSLSTEKTYIKTPQLSGVTLTSGSSSKISSELPSSSGSPQVKRVPYNRQQTYTKFSEGLVNLGFDENPDGENAQKQKDAKGQETVLEISQSRENVASEISKKPGREEKEEPKAPENSKEKSTELEPVIQGVKISQSSCSSSSESDETCDERSLLEASFSSQPEAPSSYQSASSLFTTTSEKSRKKAIPSREMKAALKVLNDSIGKPIRSGQQLTNAVNIIQREWFKVSSQKDANPHAVEDYMDGFEDYSKALLQRVVNLSDVNGNTAMHYAVSHGNFDVVSVLLDSKVCNINQQNKAGYTATMLVSLAQIRSEAHASVVQRLFQLGDVNIKASQHGQTALMLAVSHGRLDMVRMLVAAGAEINIQDEDGSTALMCAAEHGHLAIVKFLLGHSDTDPSLMDHDGSTALTIAVEAGHKDVGVLLYKHMNLSRGSSPYSSMRIKRSRTPTMNRPSITPPPRSSAPSSPGRSRKSSAPASPGRSRQSSASLSNLMI